MHPKSFVSNFWGAVQQCFNRLFCILFVSYKVVLLKRL